MSTKSRVLGVGMIGALCGIATGVQATSWLDYQLGSTVNLAIFPPASVLAAVTVACPKAGYLVATADAQMDLGSEDSLYYGYSISRDTDPDPKHIRESESSFTLNAASVADVADTRIPGFPVHMQRIDTCGAGNRFTYRFLGWTDGLGNVDARQPRLEVEFFDVRI